MKKILHLKADRNEVPTKERFFDFDVTVSHLNDTTSDGRNSSEPVEVGSLSTTIYRVFYIRRWCRISSSDSMEMFDLFVKR